MYAPMPDEWSRMSKHLSATAKALFVDALTWGQSDAELTDGALPKVDLHRCTYLPAADLDEAVQELILHGFWEDRGAAWYIWANGTIADLQITRAKRLEFKNKNRERKQRQRERERLSSRASATSSSTPSQAKPSQDIRRDSTRDVTRDIPPAGHS